MRSREKSWKTVRVCRISYRQTLSLDLIVSQSLTLETSATRFARDLLVCFCILFYTTFSCVRFTTIFHHGDEVRSKNLKRKHGLDHSKEPENTVQVFVRGKRVEEKLGVFRMNWVFLWSLFQKLIFLYPNFVHFYLLLHSSGFLRRSRPAKSPRKSDKKRTFFNLVLAKKAAQSRAGSNDKQVAPDPKVSRHELPPLDGPKTLPESICKGKGKGKTKKGKGFKKGQPIHSVGHWILLHHTPKLLVRPDSKSSLLWWHPGEHSVWTRGWTFDNFNLIIFN